MSLFDTPIETGRLKLVVAYDGTDFRGYALQRDQRTVAGEIKSALETITQTPVEITGAGRTDAGVHAWGQVVTGDIPSGFDLRKLQSSMNSMLNPRVVIRSAEFVAPDFDARFSAKWRAYRYTIVNRRALDPFRDRFAWWVESELDFKRLQLGSDVFIGEHDFASFSRKGPPGSSSVRLVLDSRWIDEGDGVLRYEICATSFCWQMVRSIVGTLVDVGQGKTKPGEIMGIIAAKDRAAASQVAPAVGLCLWEVGY